jgi:spoIIIJ-associated protein
MDNQEIEKVVKEEAEKLIAPIFLGANLEVVFFQDKCMVIITTPTKTPPEDFEVVAALQHLLRVMVEKRLSTWVPLEVDIDKFRQRQEEFLRKIALQAEEKVSRNGRPVYLRPMSSWERRVVHVTLQASPNVETESIGQEPYRKVIIKRKR